MPEELLENYSIGGFHFGAKDGRKSGFDFYLEDRHIETLEDGRVQCSSELSCLDLEPYGEKNAEACVLPQDLTPEFIIGCDIEEVYYAAWSNANGQHIAAALKALEPDVSIGPK